jgi:hypothetical protein
VRSRRTTAERAYLIVLVSFVGSLLWFFASGSKSFWSYAWMTVSALAAIVIAYRSQGEAKKGKGPQHVVAHMTSQALRPRRRGN